MKNSWGITLIALVITIIVLLILAGVSISLVMGDNGILNQATTATNKNREEEAKEDIEFAWASATTQFWNDWAKNSTVNKNDYYKKASLDKYLKEKGALERDPSLNNGIYTVDYRAKNQNELYTFLITEDGKVTEVINNSENNQIISFKIANKTYNATKLMTWNDWLNSEYNTENINYELPTNANNFPVNNSFSSVVVNGDEIVDGGEYAFIDDVLRRRTHVDMTLLAEYNELEDFVTLENSLEMQSKIMELCRVDLEDPDHTFAENLQDKGSEVGDNVTVIDKAVGIKFNSIMSSYFYTNDSFEMNFAFDNANDVEPVFVLVEDEENIQYFSPDFDITNGIMNISLTEEDYYELEQVCDEDGINYIIFVK